MSSTFSTPTDTRTRPSLMFARLRASAPMLACVLLAGCWIRDSTPPRLTARPQSLTAFIMARPASSPPLEAEADHPAGAGHLLAGDVVLRMALQARVADHSTAGCCPRNSATFNPFSQCRCMRSASVLIAAVHEERLEGRQHAAELVERFPERRILLLVLHHDHAAHDVGVAVEELGQAVHDHVHAPAEWLLEDRRHERVVDDDLGAALVSHLADGFEVTDDDVGLPGVSMYTTLVLGRMASLMAPGWTCPPSCVRCQNATGLSQPACKSGRRRHQSTPDGRQPATCWPCRVDGGHSRWPQARPAKPPSSWATAFSRPPHRRIAHARVDVAVTLAGE